MRLTLANVCVGPKWLAGRINGVLGCGCRHSRLVERCGHRMVPAIEGTVLAVRLAADMLDVVPAD